MKKNIKLFLCLIVCFILCACQISERELTEEQTGKITLKKGEEITLKLNSNPSTGYSWIFFVTPKDNNILSIQEKGFISRNKNLIGSGGISVYKIKTINKGRVSLEGYYQRAWEKLDKGNCKHVSYEITVE